MGLVGPNGAGKTTLLRLIARLDEADAGTVHLGSGTKVGYLSQEPELTPGKTVEEEALGAFAQLRRWEADLRAVEQQMAGAEGDQLTALMERYAGLTARFEAAGGYDYPARTRAVLFGLGFAAADLALPAPVLSGGQKVRLGLARLLLQQPDLLLLDEPTNHLDLDAVEWLEEHLQGLSGAVLVVSHDRYFLDRVTTRTLEIDGGRATVYSGGYSAYLAARAARYEQELAAYRQQQEEIARISFFIQKFKAGTRARQAKSKEKLLERLERVERPRGPRRQMGLRFAARQQSGDEVLQIDGLAKGFDGRTLFADVSAAVQRGDRVALVGPNGAGKTTLLRVLAGRLPPDRGNLWWGAGTDAAYFAQELDQVADENTVLEEILALPGMSQFSARTLLGRFLFPGETVDKRVGALSGGERTRLTLAKLVCSGANVLLLDEPTNHLDPDARQVLEDALIGYPGTVLLVSHDRYFLDRVANRVWELRAGAFTAYKGNYTDYREARARRLAAARAAAEAAEAAREQGKKALQQQERRARSEARREREQLRRLEERIMALEAEKQELEARMADPDNFRDAAEARELVGRYATLEQDLERLYAEWEQAAAQA